MTFEEWFDAQIWGNEDFKTCLRYAWEAAPIDEGQSRSIVGLGVVDDLRAKADLCRNEKADDIAILLYRAADEVEKTISQREKWKCAWKESTDREIVLSAALCAAKDKE